MEEQNRRIFFEYAPSFIETNIPLSPFMLPLKSGIFEDTQHTFDGLYGVFNDSLADGWGCLLLDRALQKQGLSLGAITPLQRLSMVGKNAMGALEYEPTNEINSDFDGPIELDVLCYQANRILDGKSSDVLNQLLTMNGSSGGARPKIVALVSENKDRLIHGEEFHEGYTSWMIKFASSLDTKDIGVQEYVYSLMAQKAGIETPETYLFPSKTCGGHFGVKRFDRDGKNKIHIHTACGLLHANHRTSSIDYTGLLKLTSILTRDIREVEKMIRLMIFNVKAGNKDDHSKNFSFMLKDNKTWVLTPAYDLTPSQGINGEQTAMVNGKGTNITTADFIKVAEPFGFSAAAINEIVEATDDALADYPKLLKQYK
jgi:serine/threonine-protein kinase HipA